MVSVADCRMMAFESVQEATSIWIKGREFTVARLLGDAYKDEAANYVGGALGIFRLAPQVSCWFRIPKLDMAQSLNSKDYHRFHVPVDGKIGKMTYYSGEYYTVNVSFTTASLPRVGILTSRRSASSYPDNVSYGSTNPITCH